MQLDEETLSVRRQRQRPAAAHAVMLRQMLLVNTSRCLRSFSISGS